MRSRTLGPLLHSLYRFCARQEADCRTDADLLQCFTQTHDQEAFAALVHRHGPMVLAVCQRLVPDRHEAEDAFQATFLVLVRKSAGLRKPQQLAPWLHGVARRIALRLRHQAARWQPLAEGLDSAEIRELEPLDRLAWQEMRTLLDEEIDRLPSKYRLPVVLCYLQGQSYTEAARSLGWPLGTVAVRLARAREKLRDGLVRRGLGLSASLLGILLGWEALASPVPAGLFTATVNSGVGFAAGASTLAGVVSQQVLTLAEGVMQTMWMTKCKMALMLLLVAGLVWSGLGGLAWQQGPQARAEVPVAEGARGRHQALPEGKQDQGKEITDVEKQLKALQEQIQEKQRLLAILRQGDAIDQIEAALKKLKQANAGEPQRRASVEEFEQAFGKLKQGLALPATRDLGWVSREMEAIKDRLERANAGKKTQMMQLEVLDRLDGIIKELETKRKDPKDPKLSGWIAEMKMIRAMQNRVNVRTQVYGNQYQGEQVPAPETGKSPEEKELFEMLRRDLKDLGNRQDKISKIAQALAPAKKAGR